MKTTLLFAALLLTAVLSGGSATTASGVATAGQKERAVTTFNDPVRLLGVVLKGEYLFVHDHAGDDARRGVHICVQGHGGVA